FTGYTAQNANAYDKDYINGVISIGLADFLESGNDIKDGKNKFEFTIEDSTETGSQSCSFGFWANVVIRDTENPSGKIKPFFWQDKTHNSLYGNSSNNGHIELEADWVNAAGYSSTATSGVEDKDPKVSGKIVLTGTAEDNSLLEGLWFYINGFTFTGSPETKTVDGLAYSKLASFSTSTGTWTCAKGQTAFDDGSSNFYITVENDTIDEETGKHSADWTLVIDTSKLGTVAAADVVCRIAVTDRGTLALSSGVPSYTPNTGSSTATVNTTSDANTAYYRMDVVPYVTKVTTGISKMAGNEFARSALGKYSVYAGENVTVEGFNLNGAARSATINGTSITPTLDGNSLKISVGTAATSGKLELSVGSSDTTLIPALNNKNANPTFDT
ncbi:MAG: hypothetical protein HUJ98_14795, partial [Bacteroidaceae bacterium]|nr:hypothetical protein [Bacteroidaceae bacterium]MCF0242477.1 hypothetical protein [Treponema sp.]